MPPNEAFGDKADRRSWILYIERHSEVVHPIWLVVRETFGASSRTMEEASKLRRTRATVVRGWKAIGDIGVACFRLERTLRPSWSISEAVASLGQQPRLIRQQERSALRRWVDIKGTSEA